ncbi:hypothetical protein ASPCAL09304 [Aspergillus calidoustus]|uniref:Uncharacterized protein n=1 Tax=Aspergillus calidoustus TaxID=454130 RepID=A0A0U5CRP7_ASPCI|nr:hypothetical protein ASPCAL09304 [Aspergillus calidoustus]
MPTAFLTDVQDAARLLAAAVAVDLVKNERLFAYSINRSWNKLRDRVRELFLDRPELAIAGRDTSKPISRAEEILRLVGQPGFVSEEQVLRDFVDSMYPQK